MTRRWLAPATLACCLTVSPIPARPVAAQTWRPDNGNGTFTNPLFQDEFSDPDLIRVGTDFYLTGTTMHAMPGLPVLHSTDLVNWRLMSYALDKLDLGPEYRLEDGKEVYGKGIWAPSFRYHNGTFHIFANVNGQTTQHFTATNPRGPWTRTAMKRGLHDLSVLFDDDGKVWVVWGYRDLRLAQLDSTLADIVPGSERQLFDRNSLIGEGSHLYKIDGKYYITSAWYAQRMRMPAARADRIEGPWEINPEISADEDFGLREGARLRGNGNPPEIVVTPANPASRGHMAMHQGGIVQTPAGEWWGFSMYEGNSLGRLTALSPVTWKDGWPYFGLPGNLGRSPRTWVKPRAPSARPTAPYVRTDEFSGPVLANVWQWNHVPNDSKWSLRERAGYLRLHSLPAADFWWARNSLTQRAIGPQSQPTTVLETAGMRPGDVAGLALLNRPYAWIGVRRDDAGFWVEQFDQLSGDTARVRLATRRIWLRADCDFLTEQSTFSYSTDGSRFVPLGRPFGTIFQLKTFQGVRYALFHYNARGNEGGYADFDAMRVHEPKPRGLTRPIPFGQTITMRSAGRDTPLALDGRTQFTVIDRGLGRITLRAGAHYVTVTPETDSTSSVALRDGPPGEGATFQWIETPYGDLTLMALSTNRYLRIEADGRITSDSRGPSPDPGEGTALRWNRMTATGRRPRQVALLLSPTPMETRVSTTFRGTWLLLAACAACSRSGSATRSEPGASPQPATSVASGRRDRNVITRDELADPSMSGRNVLEVVRLLRPQFLTVRGTHTVQDTATARRGVVDQDAGKVHASIDGTRVVSVEELAGVTASTVVEIRFLTPSQAMQRFGGAAREGPVILVKTN